MDCTACDATIPVKARYCPSCGAKQKTWEELMSDTPAPWSLDRADGQAGDLLPPPQDNRELRARLIDCYLNLSISKELSGWLQDLGLPSGGTTQEQLIRLRRHAGSLALQAESLPRQTIYYLNRYDEEVLSEICQELEIDGAGPKDVLLTRIYWQVGMREGWLQPLSEDARQIITETFIPIMQGLDPEKDYLLDLSSELSVGEDPMHLRVSNAYGSAIITVLIPAFFQEAQITLLQNELRERFKKRSPPPMAPDVEPLMGLS